MHTTALGLVTVNAADPAPRFDRANPHRHPSRQNSASVILPVTAGFALRDPASLPLPLRSLSGNAPKPSRPRWRNAILVPFTRFF